MRVLSRQSQYQMKLIHIIVLISALLIPKIGTSNSELPTLGNASSRLISIEQERKLGTAWLNSLRGQVATYEQPVVEDYLSQLVYSLAPNSAVEDRDFRFVILNSSELNAFAVPGSVVGINAGLFLHAGTEDEFASVLAHELAHLSQRHYARRLEQQKLSTPLTLAGVLASVILAATAGSDAGMATLASTQALSVEKSLAYSRQNEEEADRIGIETLYASSYNPQAMPMMFERMLKNSRLRGSSLPEYLSTHPLSENRVSDTKNRADQLPSKPFKDSFEYHICKAIVMSDFSESRERAASFFEDQIRTNKARNPAAFEFGQAYSIMEVNPEKALALFESLNERYPGMISIQVFLAESLYLAGRTRESIELLEGLLGRNPNNYPSAFLLAEIYQKEEQYSKAQDLLIGLTRERPDTPNLWYSLAEIHGLAGDIVPLHQARAQYFILTNQLERAMQQLQLGIKKAKPEGRQATLMQSQLDQVYELKNNPLF
jgi:predicted Zn-dependent protease